MASTSFNNPKRSVTYSLLLISLTLLASCSLFDDPQPERGIGFGITVHPKILCTPLDFPLCTRYFEGTFTRQTSFIDEAAFNKPKVYRLIFEDSLYAFDIYDIEELTIPLETGKPYQVNTKLTITSSVYVHGSFEIRDEKGLVFFATNETEMDWAYNPEPPEGWQVSTKSGGYDQHRLGCDLRGTPQIMVVTYGGQSIRLVQGQSKRLGNYQVTALVAEAVEYLQPGCFDFLAPELSYTIVRID